MTPIIEARGLTKRFGEVLALDGLNLVAETGCITALLGPNGAGKTTFVSAVATLLRPDKGDLRVAGFDVGAEPKRVRRIIGLAGQYATVEPAMTGTENLPDPPPFWNEDYPAFAAELDLAETTLDQATETLRRFWGTARHESH